jgi:alpha-beta hydrolase superfamily lysophospholipase
MNQLTLNAIRFGLNAVSSFNPTFAAQTAYNVFIAPKKGKYPATPTQLEVIALGQSIMLNGLTATTWGEGKTVLLLHGWQRSRHSMTSFVAPLLERGFRVVALDAPAHGDSAGRRMSPFTYAKTVLEVGRSLGMLEAIVAHSMGGFATIQALHDGLNVNSVVLLAAPTRSMISNPLAFANAMGLNDATQNAFKHVMASNEGIRVEDLGLEYLGRDLKPRALFVHDPEDKRVPYSDAEQTVHVWPESILETVHNLGHGGVLSDANVIAKAVRFIAG